MDKNCNVYIMGKVGYNPNKGNKGSDVGSSICKLITLPDGNQMVNFRSELIKFYEVRNAIHIYAEIKKDISYNLELSKKAYERMKPFVEQIKKQIIFDGKS